MLNVKLTKELSHSHSAIEQTISKVTCLYIMASPINSWFVLYLITVHSLLMFFDCRDDDINMNYDIT